MGTISLQFYFIFYRLLTKYRYLVALVLFVGSFLSFNLPIQSGVAGASSDIAMITRPDYDNFYLQAVNEIRSNNHLSAFIIDNRLEMSAINKNIDMINNNYWDHYSPYGLSFSDFIWHENSQAQYVGEDLARCFESREEVIQAFIKSPSHYANLVGNFKYIGFSEMVHPNSKCTYVTFHFSS